MATFKDTKGQEWSMNITIADFMALKEHDLCDLEKIFDDQDFLGGLLDGNDMIKFLGVLHELCQHQYEKYGIEDCNDFFRLLDGDSMSDATHAFIEASIAFSPAHRRATLTESYMTLKMGLEKSGETAVAELKKHRKKLLAEMDKDLKTQIDKQFEGKTS